MLNKWGTVFGNNKIKVRVFYQKENLFNGDAVEDFNNLINIPIGYMKENKKNENLSLGRKKIAFLKIFNKFVSRNY